MCEKMQQFTNCNCEILIKKWQFGFTKYAIKFFIDRD